MLKGISHTRSWLLHLVFWVGVALVWWYLRFQDYSTPAQAFWVTVIKVADLAAVIYLANLVLVPRLLYRRKYLWFALSFIGAVAVAGTLKYFLVGLVMQDDAYWLPSGMKEKIYNNFVTQFFLVLAGMALKSFVDYQQLQKQMAEVAKERAEAELNLLKSQINPHFLFNSLNAVYFLIDRNNTEARNALHRFSEMLRYQLYECGDHKIPIEKEVQFLRDYVQLQQIRQDDNFSISFECGKDVGNFLIEPLLLMPLVENSFKHVSHFSKKQNEIRISIGRTNGTFRFSVKNTTEAGTRARQPGGIGLSNVKRRLDLLYGPKHSLEIRKEADWFCVDLSLPVNLYQ
ncbi:MAG TPA: histidine kinase [Flavisolibacter sp.]